jgi:hypothetical protein
LTFTAFQLAVASASNMDFDVEMDDAMDAVPTMETGHIDILPTEEQVSTADSSPSFLVGSSKSTELTPPLILR